MEMLQAGQQNEMRSYPVGIVLINFNNNTDTVECVRSIAALNGESPFVIVVDNASKEKNIGQDLVFYPHLHTIYSEVNLGFGKANNVGIRWLKENLHCEFVFILNNDTILRRDTLKELIKGFVSSQDIVMATPKILTYEDDPKIWYGGGFFKFPQMTVNIDHFGEPDKPVEDHFVDFASGCAMLFSMQYFDREEGFDPAIFMYDEDVELCLRLKRLNQKILFVGAATLYHKCQGSQTQQKQKPVMNQLDPGHPSVRFYLSNTIPNRYYILRKHFTGLKKIQIHTTLLIYWIMKSAQYFLKGRVSLSLFTTGKALGN